MKKSLIIFLVFFAIISCTKRKDKYPVKDNNGAYCDYPNVYVPNAFTPNSDSQNDGWQIKGCGVNRFQVWVFDNDNNQLFYSNDINYSWNGEGKSKRVVAVGFYPYLIKYKLCNGESNSIKGFVEVMR